MRDMKLNFLENVIISIFRIITMLQKRDEYLVTIFRKNPSLFKDKGVMQEDMDRIKLELQEVCQLLEKEEKKHVQLKRTCKMVNDQFLETQRLQIMNMRRMQSVLTSEQQRQIAGAKKRTNENGT
ncbi:rab GTPase-binding effector protein 1 [Caerostris extrusa]|uniref:Rab GTPase-binding effector protein 1 n=1 Tax=Caerostris extrusa TaxID=172846 RepID=A0AAV4R621_CAEEX|nr:rab GTPase-binding effector protein 1 [Caerostris extrusa]